MTISLLQAPPLLRANGGVWRTLLLLILFLTECAVLDGQYSFVHAASGHLELWAAFNTALKHAAYIGIFSALTFGLMALADWRSLAAPSTSPTSHRWGRWLILQSALFIALLAALDQFRTPASAAPWAQFFIWLAGAAIMAACGALAIAPLSFWRRFAAREPLFYAIAIGVGAFADLAFGLAQNSWNGLSAATMHGAFWLLSLYEPNAFLDAPSRILGAGDFKVAIFAPCAGYEGVGLVLAGLGAYFYAFRRDLRFPAVLVLLPIGAAAIWLLNIVRIAALVSLGAHVSADFAINGFHSQAGWILFLVVTVSLMLIAHQMPAFRAGSVQPDRIADPALKLAAAMLIPFAALMGARIAAALFSVSGHWPAVLAMAAPALALFAWRKTILPLVSGKILEGAVIGLVVGLGWALTEPSGLDSSLLTGLHEPNGALWLALRLTGFVLIVPVIEELAFRGYLHRALVRRRFEDAAPAAFGWVAFIGTSVFFGAMHGRWLAGMLAGAAFALALYRSKSLSGPIAAHIAANGLIAIWTLAQA
jgi:exosortase E/protease (VPEID-CTERM system)